APDRRGEHHDRATRCRIEAGERNPMAFGYRLQTRCRIICVQAKVGLNVACDELAEGPEANDADDQGPPDVIVRWHKLNLCKAAKPEASCRNSTAGCAAFERRKHSRRYEGRA